MTGIGIITAIFALLLSATPSLAFGGIGEGGFGASLPFYLMPGPPTCATAMAGNGEATISFKPPKSDGGSPIIRYTVTSHPGKIRASGKQSPITVRGLSNGKAYTFTVSASSSSGTGLDSEPSNSVVPKAE
jgi:hypothetical protein